MGVELYKVSVAVTLLFLKKSTALCKFSVLTRICCLGTAEIPNRFLFVDFGPDKSGCSTVYKKIPQKPIKTNN